MGWKSFKEESKKNWGADKKGQEMSREEIAHGCLLRIADAIEVMAKRHTDLIDERNRYERYYNQETAARKRIENTLKSTKGHLTRARNRIKELEAQLAEKDTLPIH